jgi:RNA polymerase sigma factor (sigma-70 family)
MTDTDTRESFRALLEEHRRILYKVARAYGRSEADREDLVQEMAVQLWRAFPRFDARFRFSTWMYRVALNVAISFHRREATRHQHLAPVGDEMLEVAAEADRGPDEDVRRLYQCISRLDDMNKALALLYLDGHSHSETAEVLGISPTNVSTRLSRLKERLRREFHEAGSLSPVEA